MEEKNAQKYKNCFGKESGSEGGFSLTRIKSYSKAKIIKVF